MATKKISKPGRPAPSELVAKAVEYAWADAEKTAAAVEKAFKPTAAELFLRLAPAIKESDATLRLCEFAGVPRHVADDLRARFHTAHTELLLALSRA